MDARAFASPKGLRPRRRVKPAHDAAYPAAGKLHGTHGKVVIAGLDPAIHHLCMSYWVYILASGPGGTLYVGMTNDLVRRVYEHREGFVRGFTRKYRVKQLVYYEAHDTAIGALQREKNIKHWPREWKIDLIVRDNPTWRDLYDEIVR
jgi:putative endonuclease